MEERNGAENDSKSITYIEPKEKKIGEDHLLLHVLAPVCVIYDQGHLTNGSHYLPSIWMVVKKSKKGNIKNFSIQDQSNKSSISWYFSQGMLDNFFHFSTFFKYVQEFIPLNFTWP